MKPARKRTSHQRRLAKARLQQATCLDPRREAGIRQVHETGRALVRQAKVAVPPEQRTAIIVEDNGQGVAARKMPRPLDRLFVRSQLAKTEDQNAGLYMAGKWLEGLWQFVQTPNISTVRWDGLGGGDQEFELVERKLHARQVLENTIAVCGEHWPVLERVVCRGLPVEKKGRDCHRLRGLQAALNFLRDKHLVRRY